ATVTIACSIERSCVRRLRSCVISSLSPRSALEDFGIAEVLEGKEVFDMDVGVALIGFTERRPAGRRTPADTGLEATRCPRLGSDNESTCRASSDGGTADSRPGGPRR